MSIYDNGLLYENTSENLKIHHYDNLGSTTSLTDEKGSIITTYTYGIYGDLNLVGNGGGIKTVNGYDVIVNVGQQNKHILGTNKNKVALNNGQNKSIMYRNLNDIQQLLNDKAGTGKFIETNKERVNFEKVIGQYINPNTGDKVETMNGIIHYGKKCAHIVPAKT